MSNIIDFFISMVSKLPYANFFGIKDSENESEKLELVKAEYEYVSKEIARYDKRGVRIISIFGSLVSAAFVIGLRHDIGGLFLVIPPISISGLQMLISNNYDYRIRVRYLERIEKNISENYNCDLNFHSGFAGRYYRMDSISSILRQPLLVFIGISVTIILAIIIVSTIRGYRYLDCVFSVSYIKITYLFLLIVMSLFCLASLIWSVGNLIESQ